MQHPVSFTTLLSHGLTIMLHVLLLLLLLLLLVQALVMCLLCQLTGAFMKTSTVR
jgi:hypothetical protein